MIFVCNEVPILRIVARCVVELLLVSCTMVRVFRYKGFRMVDLSVGEGAYEGAYEDGDGDESESESRN